MHQKLDRRESFIVIARHSFFLHAPGGGVGVLRGVAPALDRRLPRHGEVEARGAQAGAWAEPGRWETPTLNKPTPTQELL